MRFKDYYKILGLETSKITLQELKESYREQAKKYHPDVNAKYEERFKDINEAYKILSDGNSKRKYDRQWNRNVGKKNDYYQLNRRKKGSFRSDLVNMFFGMPTNNEMNPEEYEGPTKGENIETEITVSIEDAFRGKNKTIEMRTVEGNLKKFKIRVPADRKSVV